MSVNYQRVTEEEREEISLGVAQGYSFRAIARRLNRSPSTISREVARNCTNTGYRAVSAQRKAARRCFRKPRKLETSPQLRHHVFMALKRQWAPAQISARLKQRILMMKQCVYLPRPSIPIFMYFPVENCGENCWVTCASTTRPVARVAAARIDVGRFLT